MTKSISHFLGIGLGDLQAGSVAEKTRHAFDDAINELTKKLAIKDISPYQSGDTDPLADGTCPDGFWPTPTPSDTYASAQQFCRPIVHPYTPTNGFPYDPPPGINEFVWKETIANAAAAFFQWGKPTVVASSDANGARPWVDQANAWYHTFKPYSPTSTANVLPWNDVPWGAMDSSVWAWLDKQALSNQNADGSIKCSASQYYENLGCHERINWKIIRDYIAANPMIDPAPNADVPQVDWMAQVPQKVHGAWAADFFGQRVPWAAQFWDEVPWMQIPWRVIDWSKIRTTNELIGALSKFTESPTTKFVACIGNCADDGQGSKPCVQACKNANPGANFSAAPCPNGGSQQNDGTCTYGQCPILGEVRDAFGGCAPIGYGPGPSFGQLNPGSPAIIQQGDAGGIHVIKPVLQKCPAGELSVNGSCVKSDSSKGSGKDSGGKDSGGKDSGGKDSGKPVGLSTGAKFGIGLALLAGIWTAGRLAMGMPVVPSVKGGAKRKLCHNEQPKKIYAL